MFWYEILSLAGLSTIEYESKINNILFFFAFLHKARKHHHCFSYNNDFEAWKMTHICLIDCKSNTLSPLTPCKTASQKLQQHFQMCYFQKLQMKCMQGSVCISWEKELYYIATSFTLQLIKKYSINFLGGKLGWL